MRGALAVLGVLASAGVAEAADPIRVDALVDAPRDRIAIFTVRSDGISTPLVAFQERARRVVEAHMHAEVVSMRETLSRGGADLNKKLIACQADAACYAGLLGQTVDVRYLLVLTASRLDELRLAGARLLDLEALRIVGESVEEVASDATFLDALAARIEGCIPARQWDPFGRLLVQVEPAGAQVTVKQRVVGLSPLREIGYLLPGSYAVSASKTGFEAAQAAAEVRQGELTKIDLVLTEAEDDSGGSWWIWAGVGAGVAVAAAVVTAVVVTTQGHDTTFCSAPNPAACM